MAVAIAPPSEQSTLPWAMSTSSLIQLRPILEYLIGVDRHTGQHTVMLATDWEVSRDGLKWNFGLRRGVPFHFGFGEFTAIDVVHSMDRLTQEGSLASSASFWRDVLERIEVVDDHAVVFVLKRPEPDLLRYVSAEGDLVMLSKAQWDAEGHEGWGADPLARVLISSTNAA